MLHRGGERIAIVTSTQKKYEGMISAESLALALKSGGDNPYLEALLKDVRHLAENVPLTDVLNVVADSNWPVPGRSEERRVGKEGRRWCARARCREKGSKKT